MFKDILFLLFVLFQITAFGQNCPSLINPVNGQTSVSVDATVTWNSVQGVTGYIIAIGTVPGGNDIISAQTSINSFAPPLGLPDDTQIYVTITLFFFNLPNIVCPSQSFRTENITIPPNCTSISSPVNNDTNINVGANILWNYVSGADGYFLTVGTTTGSGDIVNNVDVGNVLQYNPDVNFPPLTEIYVSIIPYNENGNASSCVEERFITGDIAALPNCSALISPVNGQTNVVLSPLIEWFLAPGASGYKVNIGTSPFINDILDGGIFFTNSTFVINFEPNTIYFIRIIPFNDSGDAIGCIQETFTTILGCGPFYNISNGELTTLNPEINFPDKVGICLNEFSTVISSTDEADGYRWYHIKNNGDEVLISSEENVSISEIGLYRYEAFNTSLDSGIGIECSTVKEFIVEASEAPKINAVNLNEVNGGFDVTIQASGNGDYEYSIVSASGPFQDSNFFSHVPSDIKIVYVRDKKGCGATQFEIIDTSGFPKYFTPNADGYHDYWQYSSKSKKGLEIKMIYIYDRFGKLIKLLDPNEKGWNGSFAGKLLPTSEYWYSAIASNGKVFRGHFTLKR